MCLGVQEGEDGGVWGSKKVMTKVCGVQEGEDRGVLGNKKVRTEEEPWFWNIILKGPISEGWWKKSD